MQLRKKIGLLALITSIVFISCKNDDDSNEVILPLTNGQVINVRNTLQIEADASQGGTGGEEVPVEVIFNAPAGQYNLSSTISENIEFDDYLEGLYDIDFTTNSVTFNLVADANHPIYQNFFRIIEANTFDRYYFTFTEGHNIGSFTSSNPSATLNILSNNEIVVEIGEGWDFNPGSNFTITFN